MRLGINKDLSAQDPIAKQHLCLELMLFIPYHMA